MTNTDGSPRPVGIVYSWIVKAIQVGSSLPDKDIKLV